MNSSIPSQPIHTNHSDPLLHRYLATIINYPVRYLLLSFIAVIVVGASLPNATYNIDPRALFSKDNPGLIALENVEAQFTRDDNLVFIISPNNNNVFTQENLQLIHELTEQAWTLPNVLRVDSITNFQHTEALEDELVVRNLIEDAESLTAEQIATIRKIALNEPFLIKNAISSTGHVASVNATVLAEEGAPTSPAIVAAAKVLRAELLSKYPNVDIMLGGMIPFHTAAQQVTEEEMPIISAITSLAIFFCLWVMLKNLTSVFLTFLVIILSNVVAAGSVVWFGVEFTQVMAGAPAIILTLAVADSIHLLISYQQNISDGLDKHKAMFESVRVNFLPVFLTSITTAVGFLFLNSSQSPPFVDMANMVVVGVIAAFFLSIFLLPALVVLLPTQKYKKREGSHFMEVFADFIIKRKLVIFTLSTICCAGLASQAFKNQLNDVWYEYFDEAFEVRIATEFMLDELTGLNRLMFTFPAGEKSGIMNPEYMEGLDKFVTWARRHENVAYVSSFSDTIKRLNRDMHAGDEAFYRVPEERELISQYSLMYQLSLPFGLGLEDQINIDQSATRINILLQKVTANEISAFEKDASYWIQHNLPDYMHTRGVGFDLLLRNLSYENGESMLVGTVLALLVVSFLMIFSLRSVKYGLLSMLPNLFPALIAFGIWAYIDGFIGISVSIVACMTLGIIIDDTVHFLSKYKRAKEELNLPTEQAIRYTFKTVGVALVATTIVIAANFSAMTISHYYPNFSMGLLTVITVVVALIVNFLIFVPVLLFIDNKNNQDPSLVAAAAT
ncbi:MAG: MMPL family transporter [Pseudomonadales bacterium]|nr:MMPL family transporter [Pseudomonadales bacterium]